MRSIYMSNASANTCCPMTESNLAGGCARGLTLIAMHQQLLTMQLDRMVLDQLVAAD